MNLELYFGSLIIQNHNLGYQAVIDQYLNCVQKANMFFSVAFDSVVMFSVALLSSNHLKSRGLGL